MASVSSVEAEGLSGVFVNKETPHARIEFLAVGSFFWSFSSSPGTYSVLKDSIRCRGEDGEEERFQRNDKTLVDQNGGQWLPRDQVLKMPWQSVFPVKVFVRDRETKKPISSFMYTYSISTPEADFDPLLVRPIQVESNDGSFELRAPASCEIQMSVESDGILGGFGT